MHCLHGGDNNKPTNRQRLLVNRRLPTVVVKRNGIKRQKEIGEQDQPQGSLIAESPEDRHQQPAQKCNVNGESLNRYSLGHKQSYVPIHYLVRDRQQGHQ